MLALACGTEQLPTSADSSSVPLTAFQNSGPGGSGVAENALVQGVNAPPLETLHAEFWAIAGERQTFKIRYDIPGQPEDPSPDFFRLDLKQRTLVALPDGTPLVSGDSVLITVDIDPVKLKVELSPDGLQFDTKDPAELQIWYLRADPDLNRDGIVDSLDTAIETDSLALWVQAGAGQPWVQLETDKNLLLKRVRADLFHFSGYIVSW